jgi:hypothetical protein
MVLVLVSDMGDRFEAFLDETTQMKAATDEPPVYLTRTNATLSHSMVLSYFDVFDFMHTACCPISCLSQCFGSKEILLS